MILQNIIFPSPETCTDEPMYFRREGKIEYAWCNDKITIGKYGILSFDTYFNGFSFEKWKKYTIIDDVQLNIVLQGNVRVTLMRKEKTINGIITEFVGECEYNTDVPVEYSIPFHVVETQGMFCFQIMGLNGKSYLYSGAYCSKIDINVLRNTKIALDICTFKREKYISKNIYLLNKNFLQNADSPLFDNLEVYICDNACSLDIPKLVSDKIHIIENSNVGGAGGFTRGMLEIKKQMIQKGFTHILVMDDDICIETESIYRTYVILALLKEEYKDAFIGGAMLRLDQKYIQTESGAVWNGGELVSLKSNIDLRSLDACLYNEIEETTQYNAWWYCTIPINIVTDDNLPLPLFIRGDDVEYGLRNIKYLILMNGICVWHEAFEHKYSSFVYYYILRNQLINNSVHHIEIETKQLKNVLYKWVMDEIRIYRYKNANLIMRGVEDFLEGINWFMKEDGEELHQDVLLQGYKLQYLDELKNEAQFNYSIWEASMHAEPALKFKARIINHLTVNGHYLPIKYNYNIIPTVAPQQSTVYRTKKILNYDYASKKGFVTYKDIKEAKKCIRRLRKLYERIDREYAVAFDSFEKNANLLMNVEFWNKYLKLT